MKKYLLKAISQPEKIFISLISLDLIVLLLHFLFGWKNHFFHLDFEQNLPTFYQSAKLILFGLLFFFLSFNRKIKPKIKSFLIPLTLFLIFFGFDELMQIHENIYRIFELFDWLHPSKIVDASMKMGYRSSLWLLYYLPGILIFVFWCGYWLRYFQSKMKSNFWIIGLSSLCLFTVLMAEILSSTGSYNETVYFGLVAVEEMAEMLLATTLILVGNKMLNKFL